ncbi:MAG: YeeE/YedE family protein [Saprospiraceae bacterium]|nr:YeeE/YedE family protein [Saprospiraceae bacterium]
MIDFISQPWHWSFSGFMIVVVMFILIFLGKRFGISSSFKAVCSVAGAGKRFEYFRYDWKGHDWLFVFVIGTIIGGAIASTVFASPEPVAISQATISDLAELGISYPSNVEENPGFIPLDLFTFENLATARGIILMVLGGFLIGFGTRWAGGCTSGHAISGLSELQLPSLVAVVGFFIGGLLVTHILYPIIFNI